ncbi:MAG TPA: GDSL-type esterase/lipase family protein [Chthoniobacteraceae bacterium]|nr:GDSL-type esterase/lipase family protein [Chthoniobacteraceae bacterium]
MALSPFLKPLTLLLLAALPLGAPAAEPFLRSGDVVAVAGGEEMVASAESGEMELALTVALPELHLTFRSLAWEGDTVFEQHRDLNYPPLEDQLAKMKASAVMLQFGQMESLAGPGKLQDFIATYEKLIDRLSSDGRRLLLIIPHEFARPADSRLPDLTERNRDVNAYAAAIRELAKRRALPVAEWTFSSVSAVTVLTRDGIHLNAQGEALRAMGIAGALGSSDAGVGSVPKTPEVEKLRRLIQQKNRLWFNYYRPQNWAFLAGDRVNQPSSRDHIDRNKRWFPDEMEQYVPLIEQKDRAIWEAAAALPKKTAN